MEETATASKCQPVAEDLVITLTLTGGHVIGLILLSALQKKLTIDIKNKSKRQMTFHQNA